MNKKRLSIRDGYGEGVYELVKNHPEVVVLTADLAASTRVEAVARDFPNQFVECGVSEQNMVGMAAGLALAGKVPIVNSFAVFSPGRTWDQIRVSVCYNRLKVILAGHHGGFSASHDGATHQGLEDLALTRCLPGLMVLQPSDYWQAKNLLEPVYNQNQPVYIRLSKYEVEATGEIEEPFILGRAKILTPGSDVTVCVSGGMTGFVKEVAAEIKSSLALEVLEFPTLKPFDQKTLVTSVRKTGRVVTIEDHQTIGGLGSAVAEVLAEHCPFPMLRLGIENEFGRSGSVEDLFTWYGLDNTHLKTKIMKFVNKP